MKTLLDNEYQKLDLENSIIIATWKINVIDLTVAKKTHINIQNAASGKKYPLLIKMSLIQESTTEARNFLASDDKGATAVALYVDSVLGSFISSFFIMVNKPKIPYKIFNDETKAKKWLEQFIVNDVIDVRFES